MCLQEFRRRIIFTGTAARRKKTDPEPLRRSPVQTVGEKAAAEHKNIRFSAIDIQESALFVQAVMIKLRSAERDFARITVETFRDILP